MPSSRAASATCRPTCQPATTASTTRASAQAASNGHVMSTLLFLGRRILSAVPILVLVGLITFLLVHLTPGDPAAVVAGDNASAEAIEAARHRLGLDRPFLVQFGTWLSGVVIGDLGTSFT